MTPTNTVVGVEDAHNFGRGMPVSERQRLTRRGMVALRDALPDLVEQLARRCIQDAVASALPETWLCRAEELEAVGTAWADEAAKGCRRHAWLLAQGLPEDAAAELDAFLTGEVV